MSQSAARDEICRIGRSLYERGYVHASAGNISMRLDDGFLITPTDACLGTLQPQQLAHVDPRGEQRSGERASKTLALHRRIYAADTAAQCVLHTHSTHCVALTLAGVWQEDCVLPAITPYFVMKVGRVPLVPYHRPGDPAVADRVADHIAAAARRGTSLRAVLLERLGPLVWHASPAAAMAALEELEETARLWHMTDPKPRPLTDAQIELLCSTFAVRW
jgi:ribulose-5-phosphate 4-epimerase/fuculose-1-phosphate aldolase